MSGVNNKLTAAQGWVGRKTLAEHLKISQSSVRNWMKQGLIPYVRVGRSVRFKLIEVDEAVNRRLRVEARY